MKTETGISDIPRESYNLATRQDPLTWIWKVLGVQEFSKGQAEILDSIPASIAERRPLVIPSANAQGKDFIVSGIGLWFLHSFVPSKIIFTAPTDRQVKEIMWSEIESRINSARVAIQGKVITCKIEVSSEHFLLGFTTKETGQMTGKFQGFHSPHICVIVSEAQAVGDKIFEQIEGITTSGTVLYIMIGNPLRTSGHFARAIKNTTKNIVIPLNALDSPNWRHQKNVIPGMASIEWIKEKTEEWGQDHVLYQARVLGQLPKSSIDSVFSPELIDKMVNAEIRTTVRKITVYCDPARMGDDECVTTGMISGKLVKTDVMPQSKGDQVVSHILQMAKLIGANTTGLEGDGLGGPIGDFVEELKPANIEHYTFMVGGEAEDKEHYQNLRAEMWDYAAKQAALGMLSIPDDQHLIEELSEVKYFYNGKGKYQIEAKEDIKERLGRSPNRADSFIQNVWLQKQAIPIKGEGKYTHDDGEVEDTAEVDCDVESAFVA